MFRTRDFIVAAAITAGLTGTAAHAAVLASYDFEVTPEGTSNSSSTAATDPSGDVDVNSTASVFSTTYMLNDGNSSHKTGVNDWVNTAGDPPVITTSEGTGTSLGTAPGAFYVNISDTPEAITLADSTYLTFNITPNLGNDLDLSSLTFDIKVNAANSNVVSVASSANSFGSFLSLTVGAGAVTTQGSFTSTYQQVSVDLSGATFQNLTSATEFRIFLADSGPSSGRSARIDNVVLNGTVTVPEPASIAALGLAGVGLVSRRRRA